MLSITKHKVKELFKNGLDYVTPDDWEGFVQYTLDPEEMCCRKDVLVEDIVDQLIIRMGLEVDSSDDEMSNKITYELNSDDEVLAIPLT